LFNWQIQANVTSSGRPLGECRINGIIFILIIVSILTLLEILLKKVILVGDSMGKKTYEPGLQVAVNREPNSFCFDLIRGLVETFIIIRKPELLRSLWNRF
jgi:hypothetical protein